MQKAECPDPMILQCNDVLFFIQWIKPPGLFVSNFTIHDSAWNTQFYLTICFLVSDAVFYLNDKLQEQPVQADVFIMRNARKICLDENRLNKHDETWSQVETIQWNKTQWALNHFLVP